MISGKRNNGVIFKSNHILLCLSDVQIVLLFCNFYLINNKHENILKNFHDLFICINTKTKSAMNFWFFAFF